MSLQSITRTSSKTELEKFLDNIIKNSAKQMQLSNKDLKKTITEMKCDYRRRTM